MIRPPILALILFWIVHFSTTYAYERNIALITREGWRGEVEFAYRIQKACQHMNWHADIVDIHDTSIYEKKYDFAICLVPKPYTPFKFPCYLCLFHPKHHYFNENGYLAEPYTSYDGYLLSYPLGSDKKDFTDYSKHPYLFWLPTTQRFPYKQVYPKHLFYMCCLWGERAFQYKYKELLKKLNWKKYTRLYGAQEFKKLYPNSYVTSIPFDGESLLRTINKNGVCLVLHSKDHLAYGIPSGRIFEAAASSSIIISDKNDFVIKNFGDSVLYVESNTTGKEIYRQIDRCMKWIQANPREALARAQKSYEIFATNFTLENQLYKLGMFHDEITSKK